MTDAKEGYMQDLKKITETTLIPISLAIVLFGGVFWMSTIWNTMNTNSKFIAEIKADKKIETKEISDKFDKILNELYYLKGAIAAAEKKGN